MATAPAEASALHFVGSSFSATLESHGCPAKRHQGDMSPALSLNGGEEGTRAVGRSRKSGWQSCRLWCNSSKFGKSSRASPMQAVSHLLGCTWAAAAIHHWDQHGAWGPVRSQPGPLSPAVPGQRAALTYPLHPGAVPFLSIGDLGMMFGQLKLCGICRTESHGCLNGNLEKVSHKW